jgi:hypothetical protein
MKIIGYLEGTDPELLGKLVLDGHGTLPLGNGWDGHGKYINHLTKDDKVDAVVGYLHKIFPPEGTVEGPRDVLFSCRVHKIPVYLIVPKEKHKAAQTYLKHMAEGVTLVDPSEVYEVLIK